MPQEGLLLKAPTHGPAALSSGVHAVRRGVHLEGLIPRADSFCSHPLTVLLGTELPRPVRDPLPGVEDFTLIPSNREATNGRDLQLWVLGSDQTHHAVAE